MQILKTLLAHWEIGNLKGLNEGAEKARDYLMKLPERLEKLSVRVQGVTAAAATHRFGWVST